MTEKKRKTVIGIRWIVTGAAVCLTALAVAAVGAVAERNAREALNTELQRRVVLEARNLALTSSRALLSDFPELTLAPILNQMTEGRDELEFAVVADLNHVIRGHADARRIGEEFTRPPAVTEVNSDVADPRRGETLQENASILVASSPVLHPNGDKLGEAWVAIDRGYVRQLISEARRKQAIVVLVVLAVGVLFVLLILSAILRPIGTLRAGLERIGSGDFTTHVKLHDRTEFGLLADTINEMADAIRDAQSERLEKDRLVREVELAREIQSSLLPHESIRAEGVTVDGAHRAAAEVGGDLWDVFPLGDGRVGVAIADVSGKGLGGCLVTSMVSALLRAFRNDERSPARLLVRLEESLPLRAGTFITMFYGIYDPKNGSLVFASAGHSPVLVHRAATGKAEWYKTKGIPIGAVRGGALAKTVRDERIVLDPGDVLVQYTDGVNEAFDTGGRDQFGFARLQDAVKASAAKGAAAIVNKIREDLRAWVGDQPPFDDETLVVLCRDAAAVTPPPAPAAGGTERRFDPVRMVREARKRGHGIRFHADLDELHRLEDWVTRCEGLTLDSHQATLVQTALYELCANVAEHGYEGNPSRTFELWWLECAHAARVVQGDAGCGAQGVFVLVDDGHSYDAKVPSVNFEEASVRRRGRGIGLTIVHRAMEHVSYHPQTEEGNVTIVTFDPKRQRAEEVSHG
ncbi:MAG: SpoIIE family protein phosphatase [Gemmatimonadetes bacterium]|nr:SpoIIE family protein phosphatase [Gemmatimonadota bacterium]